MNNGPMVTFQEGSSQHRTFVIGSWVLFALGAIALPYVLWDLFGLFQVGRLNRALYFAVAILGVNLVVGYSGLIALGHSAFVGIGAFLTIWLINDMGWDYWATIPVAIAAGFLVGVLLGVPALRIKGLYLALLTIAFAAVFPSLMKLDKFGIKDATGGANGRNIDEPLVAPSWAQSLLGINDTPDQQEIHQEPAAEPARPGDHRHPRQRDRCCGERCEPAALQDPDIRRERRARLARWCHVGHEHRVRR